MPTISIKVQLTLVTAHAMIGNSLLHHMKDDETNMQLQVMKSNHNHLQVRHHNQSEHAAVSSTHFSEVTPERPESPANAPPPGAHGDQWYGDP